MQRLTLHFTLSLTTFALSLTTVPLYRTTDLDKQCSLVLHSFTFLSTLTRLLSDDQMKPLMFQCSSGQWTVCLIPIANAVRLKEQSSTGQIFTFHSRVSIRLCASTVADDVQRGQTQKRDITFSRWSRSLQHQL